MSHYHRVDPPADSEKNPLAMPYQLIVINEFLKLGKHISSMDMQKYEIKLSSSFVLFPSHHHPAEYNHGNHHFGCCFYDSEPPEHSAQG
jgi:hypothetical protein